MPGTTPVYGFPYPQPTDLVADYPALGQQLAEDIEGVLPTLGGLTQITPTSIANSGGTSSLSGGAVNFTTVNSVSLNGVFTSTYDAFRVILNVSSASTGNNVALRLRAAGTDASGANYAQYALSVDISAVTANSGSGLTSVTICSTSATNGAIANLELNRPALAVHTGIFTTTSNWSAPAFGSGLVLHQVNTAYDGFSLIASTGTVTGTVRVYGYKK